MTVETKKESTDVNADPNVPFSFRHRESVRETLELIGRKRGLEELSDVLRDAVDRYIKEFFERGP